MFAPPLPPVSAASAAPTNANPNPFPAESLLPNQADLLRRELDSRFLASQDRSLNVGPPPYLRTEMHHHQHQHTHVHQHSASQALLGAPPTPTPVFPPPLFKDVPKLGGIDSPFYRQNPLGLGSYPGYPAGLLPPSLGNSTPFAPPSHMPSFTPKVADPSKPKSVKSGKWNAMHVRIAWEIYGHQQKSQTDASKLPAAAQGQPGSAPGKPGDLLRAPPIGLPSHLYPPGSNRPHDLPPSFAALPAHRAQFDPAAAAAAAAAGHPGYLTGPGSHLGNSPFGRYPSSFPNPTSTSFAPLGYPPGPRELAPLGPLGGIHDHWRLQRTPSGFPVTAAGPWNYKSDANVLEERERSRERERDRERERERQRREREREEQRAREREREEQRAREREEKRKLDAEREKERERREKEKRDQERREQERERERERERIMHHHQQQQQHHHLQAQQRLAESKARERSPIRNGGTPTDVDPSRVKDENRTVLKEEDLAMLSRTPGSVPSPFPHYLSRLPMLDRSRTLPPPHPSAYSHAPPGAMWPGADPYRDHAAAAAAYSRFDPMRGLQYNPLMSALQEEERAKLYGQFAGGPPPMSHLRAKDPSPPAGMLNNHQFHHRPNPPGLPPGPHKMAPTPPGGRPLEPPMVVDLHKKEEPATQSR